MKKFFRFLDFTQLRTASHRTTPNYLKLLRKLRKPPVEFPISIRHDTQKYTQKHQNLYSKRKKNSVKLKFIKPLRYIMRETSRCLI